jgi:hypothetical protein
MRLDWCHFYWDINAKPTLTIITGGNRSSSSVRLGFANLAGLEEPAEGESIKSLLFRFPRRLFGPGVFST